jgi:DNA-directed RNA polymerase subunit M/transcription elongation factor TFIIS
MLNKYDIGNIRDFDAKAEYMKIFDFKTTESLGIKKNVIQYAIKNINRHESITLLTKLINYDIACDIEKGILEYTLIVVSNRCPDILSFVNNIYRSKLIDIYNNLDTNNSNINNKTLNNSVSTKMIDPYYLAFMKPQQLHHINWEHELEKKRVIEEANDVQFVTDIYKCYKCGDKKCTTVQLQTRSGDEPMTIFVTCITCHNTFTK